MFYITYLSHTNNHVTHMNITYEKWPEKCEQMCVYTCIYMYVYRYRYRYRYITDFTFR